MRTANSRLLSPLLAGVVTLATAAPALAVEVSCGSEGGDGFGWSVASDKDFDGDQVHDIAVGAPCAVVGTKVRVGRVRVFSGATGRRILSLTGTDTEQFFGAAVEFVPDLDGDGRAELAIGSPTFAAPKDGGGTIKNAGKLELRSSKGTTVWTVFGKTAQAKLGETVAVMADVSGDGKSEIVVGASGAQVDGERKGIGYLLSGANGTTLAENRGVKKTDFWGSIVAAPGDVDGDHVDDWIVASNAADVDPPALPMVAAEATTTTTSTTTSTTVTTTTLVEDVGVVRILSGAAGTPEIVEVRGQRGDRLGRSVAGLSDHDGDEIRDVLVGAPGVSSSGLADAGRVTIFSGFGEILDQLTEPTPQEFAGFGTSVCAAGSMDGGAGDDIVAGAPFAKVSGLSEAGRVHGFDGADGSHLWTHGGSFAASRFGQSLAAGLDYDGDEVADVVVGAPGDAPNGRRGAGAAYVLSGVDGEVLDVFGGRRGRETRLFVAGPGLGRVPTVRSFDSFGHRREAEIRPFRAQRTSQLSMAVLDEGSGADGNKILLAVAAGRDGDAPNVSVYRAGRRRLRLSSFAAGPVGYLGGLSIASGDFSAEAGEELAAAPADDAGATTTVVVHRRQFTDPIGRITWTKVREFPAFAAADKVEGETVGAHGVFLAAADLVEDNRDEIVVAPAAGLPVFRVLTNTGTKIAERLAYPAQGPGLNPNSGTAIALGDLDGNGKMEIVTAPASGQLWIRAWQTNGDPWEYATDTPVSFFVTQYGPLFEGGLRLATADVDLDGEAEILVAPGAGVEGVLLAFEPDGSLVEGWEPFSPFGPLADEGLMLIGTDQFWRP